jgi:hypothetical protein
MASEDDWAKRRLVELQAATPAKRKKTEPFVKVPLWWAAAAAKATHTPSFLICIELLYASWKAKSQTFPLPNGRLMKVGISRETKRRVLHNLARAGLIHLEQPSRKTLIITLVGF